MKWSEEAWKKAEHIYHDILTLPFVKELTAGTLSMERFLFYIRQDAIYIENYSRVLAHIASRLPRKDWLEDFLKFASDGVLVEKAMHASFTEISNSNTTATPTCLLYCSMSQQRLLNRWRWKRLPYCHASGYICASGMRFIRKASAIIPIQNGSILMPMSISLRQRQGLLRFAMDLLRIRLRRLEKK